MRAHRAGALQWPTTALTPSAAASPGRSARSPQRAGRRAQESPTPSRPSAAPIEQVLAKGINWDPRTAGPPLLRLGRRIATIGSNMLELGLRLLTGEQRTLYSAGRRYEVLSPGATVQMGSTEGTAQELAERHKPIIVEVAQGPKYPVQEMRYEVLQPVPDYPLYRIVYYVKRADEDAPNRILDGLYDALRWVLFGNKADWEAITVTVNGTTDEPLHLAFESSEDFWLTVHQRTDVVHGADDRWIYSRRIAGKVPYTARVPNPFNSRHRPTLAGIGWNGSFELPSRLEGAPVHAYRDVPLSFLDDHTYRANDMSLRTPWIRNTLSPSWGALPPRESPGDSTGRL